MLFYCYILNYVSASFKIVVFVPFIISVNTLIQHELRINLLSTLHATYSTHINLNPNSNRQPYFIYNSARPFLFSVCKKYKFNVLKLFPLNNISGYIHNSYNE